MDCQTIQALLDDQLENLSADERTEVEEHLEQCPACNEELIDQKKNSKARSRKPMITWILFGVVSLIFVLVVITSQAEPVVKSIGEGLNISATNNDIKVTITDFIADDYQTVIHYQIEDLSEGKYYQIDSLDGLDILFDSKPLVFEGFYEDYNFFEKQENIYYGKLYTGPLKNIEDGIIELQLTKLQLTGDEEMRFNVYEDEMIVLEGEWNFEIPVTVQTAIVKELDIEKELAGTGITFFFNQLIMAPTGTTLSYQYATDGIRGQLVFINFTSISSYDRVYQLEDDYINVWDDYIRVNFESVYLDKPDHVLLHVDNYNIHVTDQTEFAIDQTMESQSFDFLGTNITVDLYLNEEQETIMEITEETDANRPYEMLYYNIVDGNGITKAFEIEHNYYLVDKSGEIHYEENWEALEEPRLFSWSGKYVLESSLVESNQPIFLRMVDYNKTIVVEETIRLDLD